MNLLKTVALIFAITAQSASAEPTASLTTGMIAAMSGEWSGVMRAEVPPDTEEFPWRASCAPVALGAGVLCHSEGTASIGPIAQSCLIAVAPGEEEVHLMCVSSMGEVHDHRGRYVDGAIRFEPLRAAISGAIVEEIVEYRITPGGEMQTLSVVRATGRPDMRFTLRATRQGAG